MPRTLSLSPKTKNPTAGPLTSSSALTVIATVAKSERMTLVKFIMLCVFVETRGGSGSGGKRS